MYQLNVFIINGSSKTFPTTSQPAIGEWIENYEKLRDKGYTDIIVIALSSGISGSYQSATQAGEMVEVSMFIRLIVNWQR